MDGKRTGKREKKRKNIVIAGLIRTEGAWAEVVEDWLKEKLGLKLEVKVKKLWSTGGKKPKLGVHLDSRKGKEEVMRNKCKLKKTTIFIEYDMTWKKSKQGYCLEKSKRGGEGEGEEV